MTALMLIVMLAYVSSWHRSPPRGAAGAPPTVGWLTRQVDRQSAPVRRIPGGLRELALWKGSTLSSRVAMQKATSTAAGARGRAGRLRST